MFCWRLSPSSSGIDAPAARFELGNVLEHGVGVETPVPQARPYLLDVVANVYRIEHVYLGFIVLSPEGSLSHQGRFFCYDPLVPQSVRRAVFPVAGLGTRFLPATKAQPKEMLPLVDKPIIQYGVEEAVASGIDNIILVTGRGKNAIEDHFDVSVELESFLEARGKRDQLAEIRKISNMINFAYVRQGEPLGLGHAVLVTRELVGDEPFAVILGDDVIDADAAGDRTNDRRLRAGRRPGAGRRTGAARRDLELRRHRHRRGRSRSAKASTGSRISSRSRRARRRRRTWPSSAATFSRRTSSRRSPPPSRTGPAKSSSPTGCASSSSPGRSTPARSRASATTPGNKLGYLKAVVYFALKRPDLADKFTAYLQSLNLPIAVKR